MVKQWLMAPLQLALLLAVLLFCALIATMNSVAGAYAPEADFLQIKGYSPEIIDSIVTQRYRQEWRYPPPPKRRPKDQILRNIFINDPLGNIDPFGSYKIRERM